MAIDLRTETVLSLTDAADFLPRRRRGKRPHFSTLYRWALKGFRGVRLETIRIGGTLCTSKEALQRFADHLVLIGAAEPTRSFVSSSRHRAQLDAERELDKASI